MARHWSAIALTIVLSVVCYGLIGVAAMAGAAAGEPTEAEGFSTIGSAELAERLTDKDFVIILYCRSGRMSEIAARELVRRGFTRVSHLSGGMVEWERSGHPLLRK